MYNPFTTEDPLSETDPDIDLVTRATGGDSKALESLIHHHQSWIYNIALRMTGDPMHAEDVSQEILIKIVTHLSTFRQESSFRTWLYRIVANHVLNMKRRPKEFMFSSLDFHGELLDSLPELPMPRDEDLTGQDRLAVEETKQNCLTGMLLCLDRPERIAFIFGGIFAAEDRVAAEFLGTTPITFRKRLSRARQHLLAFMNGRCGLLDPRNPCRCAKKTKAAIHAGYVDPDNLVFTDEHLKQVHRLVHRTTEEVQVDDVAKLQSCFRQTPFRDPPDLVTVLREIRLSPEFRGLIEF
jgi:RNA polymerase sigma factor (sigma-70 family)